MGLDQTFKTMISPNLALVFKSHILFHLLIRMVSSMWFSALIYILGQKTFLCSVTNAFFKTKKKYGWRRKEATVVPA